MPKNRPEINSFPDWLQFYVEQNIGKVPVWQFPPIPEMPEGFCFKQLTFRNRFHLLDLFKKDKDPWVDERFKKPKSVYEYVCMSKIIMPYSFKRGGQDWLVYQKKECIGILHAFEFSKESGEFTQRRCAVGYAFGQSVRGSGLPQKVIRHLQNYLFTKWNMLCLSASVKRENIRSIRFLKGLGYIERLPERDWQNNENNAVSDTVVLDLFRSKRTQNKIQRQWVKETKAYSAWRATWIKQSDGSYKIPTNYSQ